MAILAVEATHKELVQIFIEEEERMLLAGCDPVDMDRGFNEDGHSYNIFAVYRNGLLDMFLEGALSERNIDYKWL